AAARTCGSPQHPPRRKRAHVISHTYAARSADVAAVRQAVRRFQPSAAAPWAWPPGTVTSCFTPRSRARGPRRAPGAGASEPDLEAGGAGHGEGLVHGAAGAVRELDVEVVPHERYPEPDGEAAEEWAAQGRPELDPGGH